MTIAVPEKEDLDEMSKLVCGYQFDMLPSPNEKARVIELCLANERNAFLSDISTHFESGVNQLEAIQQTLQEHGKEVLERLDNLDEIRHWFEKSKLFDGIPNG